MALHEPAGRTGMEAKRYHGQSSLANDKVGVTMQLVSISQAAFGGWWKIVFVVASS